MEAISIAFEKLILDKKPIFRRMMSFFMIAAGISHFIIPGQYIKIVPGVLPNPAAIVYVSGVFEILGGIGLLVPQVSALAAWGLVLLFIAVYPANLNMAINGIEIENIPNTWWFQAIRLPLQFVLIAWAWWLTKPDERQNNFEVE